MVLTSVTIGSEVYNAYLCCATNFFNAPRIVMTYGPLHFRTCQELF